MHMRIQITRRTEVPFAGYAVVMHIRGLEVLFESFVVEEVDIAFEAIVMPTALNEVLRQSELSGEALLAVATNVISTRVGNALVVGDVAITLGLTMSTIQHSIAIHIR